MQKRERKKQDPPQGNMPQLQIDVRVTSDNTAISLGPAPAKLCIHMRTYMEGCRL